MYPEGGDLVAGLPARVYLEAFTPAHKPADLAGVVVDAKGEEVATFKTEHEGRGRFEFTPARGGKYTLKIRQPSGIKTTYPLPPVKDEGAVLTAAAEVTAADAPVKLRVARSAAGKVKVTLAKRDVQLAAKTIDVEAGKWADVELSPDRQGRRRRRRADRHGVGRGRPAAAGRAARVPPAEGAGQRQGDAGQVQLRAGRAGEADRDDDRRERQAGRGGGRRHGDGRQRAGDDREAGAGPAAAGHGAAGAGGARAGRRPRLPRPGQRQGTAGARPAARDAGVAAVRAGRAGEVRRRPRRRRPAGAGDAGRDRRRAGSRRRGPVFFANGEARARPGRRVRRGRCRPAPARAEAGGGEAGRAGPGGRRKGEGRSVRQRQAARPRRGTRPGGGTGRRGRPRSRRHGPAASPRPPPPGSRRRTSDWPRHWPNGRMPTGRPGVSSPPGGGSRPQAAASRPQRLRRRPRVRPCRPPRPPARRPGGLRRDALLERRRADRRQDRPGDGGVRHQRRRHQLPRLRRRLHGNGCPRLVGHGRRVGPAVLRRAQAAAPGDQRRRDPPAGGAGERHAERPGRHDRQGHGRQGHHGLDGRAVHAQGPRPRPPPAGRRAGRVRRHGRLRAGGPRRRLRRQGHAQAGRPARRVPGRVGPRRHARAGRVGVLHRRDPGRRRPQFRLVRPGRLPDAAGEPDPGVGGPDPVAERLLRADVEHDLPAGHGPAVFPDPHRRRSEADRPQPHAADRRVQPADRVRVQAEQGVRVVRGRPRPRGPQRLRPAGVHRHGRRPRRGRADAGRHAGVRHEVPRRQGRVQAGAGHAAHLDQRPRLLQRLHHLGPAGVRPDGAGTGGRGGEGRIRQEHQQLRHRPRAPTPCSWPATRTARRS